jgi:hypothetical protein
MRKFTSSLIVLVLFCSIFFAFSLVSADDLNAASTDDIGGITSLRYAETNILGMLRDTLYPFAVFSGDDSYNYYEDNYNVLPYKFWDDGSVGAVNECFAGRWAIGRGFFEFNTSGLPDNFVVDSASLKFNVYESVGNGYYRIVKTNWSPDNMGVRDSLENGIHLIGEDVGYFGGKSFKTLNEVNILVDSNSSEAFDTTYSVRELFVIDENIHNSIQAGTNIYVFRVDYKRKPHSGYGDYGLVSGSTTYVDAYTFEPDVYTEYSLHWYGSYGDVVSDTFSGYRKDVVITYEGYYDNSSISYVACSDSFQLTGAGWTSIPLNANGLSEIQKGNTYFAMVTEADYNGQFGSDTCNNFTDVYMSTVTGSPYLKIFYTEGEPEPENAVPTKPVILEIGGIDANNSIVDDLTPSGNGTGSTDEDLDTLYYCWLTIETGGDFGTPDFNTTFSETVDVLSLGNLVNATEYDTILVVTDLTDTNQSDVFNFTTQVLEEIEEEPEIPEEEPDGVGVILGGGGTYQGVLNTDQPSSFYRISFDGEMKTGQKVRATLVEQNINFCYNKVGYGTINYYKTGDSNLQGLPMVWMKCDNEQSKGYWYRDLIFTKPGAYIFEGDNLFYEAEINITGKEIIKPKESPLLKATGLREKLQALDLNEGIQTVKEIPVAIYNGLSWVADLLMNNAEKLIN